jgi:nucleoside-diphosphate-sugar epimerase
MKVFLTGGTGFIGQALVRRIRRRNWDLQVLVRNLESAQAGWISRQGATLVRGDVTNAQGLETSMAGADVIVHNAGVYEIGADKSTAARMQAANVEGTKNVLAAAKAAGAPRSLYVSSAWALGPSGRAPGPSPTCDETQRHDGRYLTIYERSKAEAHRIALRLRDEGLPLSIAVPNGVVGANDHSPLGYNLRLTLLGAMAPVGFGGETVYSFVDVDALAEGICLTAERARMGEDYLFCGDRASLREIFELWRRETGKTTPRWYLPRSVMRAQMAALEPLQRSLGLPRFMSRELVDQTRGHLDYSSAKAKRELKWTHPNFGSMWPAIIRRERELMASRSGFLNKLRHQPVVE